MPMCCWSQFTETTIKYFTTGEYELLLITAATCFAPTIKGCYQEEYLLAVVLIRGGTAAPQYMLENMT